MTLLGEEVRPMTWTATGVDDLAVDFVGPGGHELEI